MNNYNQSLTALLNEVPRETARRYHLGFIQHCWQKLDPFLIGLHTQAICERIDRAFEQYDNDESVFIILKVPFRHGKTDIVSRYLPPHYLGKYPDNEILIATYGADFAHEISRASRTIIKSEKYQELYQDIDISTESASVQNWGVKDKLGNTHWVGVGGSITGKGYHLGIIDDFLKNREDAESQTIRGKQWQWFTDVFLTRRAPTSITIVLATPWHLDDIMGRIEVRMKKDSNFPRFEVIRYPAFSDEYKTGTLFPERFGKEWYIQQKATLGTYGTASLLQCNPVLRGGNLLKTDRVKIVNPENLPFLANLKWNRGWDLASSEKELIKDEPDYTVGGLIAVRYVNGVPEIYVKDIRRLREEAPARNRVIQQCAKMDGPGVKIGIESVAGYKDTVTIMRDILKGISNVVPIGASKDKVVRASILEPVFEAGNVYLFKADWNYAFITELSEFPSGKHDDQVDALGIGYRMGARKSGSFADIPDETYKSAVSGLMKKEF